MLWSIASVALEQSGIGPARLPDSGVASTAAPNSRMSVELSSNSNSACRRRVLLCRREIQLDPSRAYLRRYTHRVAISNHRLIAFDGELVTFRWKDYAHGGKLGQMKLRTCEFLRRFFLHVLPKAFVRIRHFGFLTNRFRASRVSLCRQLLALLSRTTLTETTPATYQNALWHCPTRGAAMIILQRFTAADYHHALLSILRDTSTKASLWHAPACRCTRVLVSCARTTTHSSHSYFRPYLQTYRASFPLLLPSFLSMPSSASVPNSHSIPIVQRVRRNRRRLPSSVLIENASDPLLDPRTLSCPRHFRSSLATIRPSGTGLPVILPELGQAG